MPSEGQPTGGDGYRRRVEKLPPVACYVCVMGARYRITEPLGRGARVFRGVAESSDGRTRDVVITGVVESLPNNQRFAAMILDDVRAAASLHHANVVDLVDIAKTPEGAYFVVSEYADGCDLKTFVSQSKRALRGHT
jgi:serine/threonine protein kinase